MNYARVFSDPRSYLYGFDQTVKIEDIESRLLGRSAARRGKLEDPSCTKITIDYSNDLLGHQDIVVTHEGDEPLTDSEFLRCLETVFILHPESDRFAYYALNTKTNTLHSALCDHLTEAGVVRSREIPTVDGLRLCSACFQKPPSIPDLALELRLGQVAKSNYLNLNITLKDRAVQQHVTEVGDEVLARWPLPLRGYDYRFIVMDSRTATAFAAPGGTIFISSGLLGALEGTNELMAVLAHEIAHVEFRHGLRQFRSAQKAALVSGIAAVVAGAAVASATDDANAGAIATGVVGAASELFSQIAINGYSQQYELEADQIGALFLSTQLGDTAAISLRHVLKKLRYEENEAPYTEGTSAFASHPSISERLLSLKKGHFTLHDPPLLYRAFDKHDHKVADLEIIADHRLQYVDRKRDPRGRPVTVTRIVCYANIETTPYLQEPSEVKHFEFTESSARFDNEQDTKLIPGESGGIVFYYDSEEPFTITDDLALELKLRNVEYCKGPLHGASSGR